MGQEIIGPGLPGWQVVKRSHEQQLISHVGSFGSAISGNNSGSLSSSPAFWDTTLLQCHCSSEQGVGLVLGTPSNGGGPSARKETEQVEALALAVGKVAPPSLGLSSGKADGGKAGISVSGLLGNEGVLHTGCVMCYKASVVWCGGWSGNREDLGSNLYCTMKLCKM